MKKETLDTNNNLTYYNFEGCASTFGNLDIENDIVSPNAFDYLLNLSKDELKKTDIKFLWQHDKKIPIGIITDIEIRKEGLFVK